MRVNRGRTAPLDGGLCSSCRPVATPEGDAGARGFLGEPTPRRAGEPLALDPGRSAPVVPIGRR
jgi:hypothetical protein